MKANAVTLKTQARRLLNGQFGTLALLTFSMTIFHFILDEIIGNAFPNLSVGFGLVVYYACSLLATLLYFILMAGMYRIYLHISRNEGYQRNELFFGFSNMPEHIAPYAIIEFAMTAAMQELILYLLSHYYQGEALSSMLPFILAVPVLYLISFAVRLHICMVPFLYSDRPDLTGMQLLKESCRLMKGNRLKMFYLELSFIGVELLGYLSLGIGLLYVRPYVYTTQGLFYLQMQNEEELN